MDEELNSLKASVNLVEYAACRNYWVDKQKSCRRTTVMRHDNGDKIVVSRGSKCWMYFSARNDSDNGTIIDFIQKRNGAVNLGEVKKQLRSWLGRPQPQLVEKKYKALAKGERDIEAVRSYIQGTKPIRNTDYLQSRHIPAQVIFGERFGGTIRQDRRGNTVFLHRNLDGFCGAELKNSGFTGCPKDSVKGVWHSRLYETDRRLVLCESGIDNLSYHSLKGGSQDRHISTAGNFSPDQQLIVKRAIEKMPPASCIVAAFDNDAQGAKYAAAIEAMVGADKRFLRERPQTNDWNEDLKQKAEQQTQQRPKIISRPSMQRV